MSTEQDEDSPSGVYPRFRRERAPRVGRVPGKKGAYDEGSLDQYLRDISAYPLISREDEVDLARLIMRVKVMSCPEDDGRCAGLNRRLLELNAMDLLHGSYGIEGDDIVLTEALELSHLDYEEFLATYESMTLALASHLRELASYREER